MVFSKKYKELEKVYTDLLVDMRNGKFDDIKAAATKEALIGMYNEVVKTEEGKRVTALAGPTALILEELSGFACETDDDEAQMKALDLHDDIANVLYRIGEPEIKKEENE